MAASSNRTRVPYLDLRAQYQGIKAEVQEAIAAVLETNAFVLGPAVAAFESAFASFCENQHCIGVNNGTSALHLALLASGIGPGDEVITQANTFIATVAAIMYTGAKPVLVDVAPPTFAIDADAVERAITPRTKAIIPVHLFGHPCELDAIQAIAERRGVLVIEDASQAHGATYRGRAIGHRHLATFSFYPGKNLGAAGEAGAVVTNDAGLDRRMRLLRNHGSEQKYLHEALGYNYRMEGLQGAVLGVKLRHLERWTHERRRIASLYDNMLGDLSRPVLVDDTQSAYHIYPVLVENRERVAETMKLAGVETNIHYPVACHLQPGYVGLNYKRGDFPHCERIALEELSLPIYPEMTDDMVTHVAKTLVASL